MWCHNAFFVAKQYIPCDKVHLNMTPSRIMLIIVTYESGFTIRLTSRIILDLIIVTYESGFTIWLKSDYVGSYYSDLWEWI
jgi:hypothetical protein